MKNHLKVASDADVVKKKGTISSMWGTKKKPKSVDSEGQSSSETMTNESSSEAMDPKHRVLSVVYDMGDDKFRGEGRTITVEFEKFFLVCCYVPNSGDGLHRLDYRINEWYVRC